jgi:hypothetical protein
MVPDIVKCPPGRRVKCPWLKITGQTNAPPSARVSFEPAMDESWQWSYCKPGVIALLACLLQWSPYLSVKGEGSSSRIPSL